MSFGRLLEDSKAGESMFRRRVNAAFSGSSKVPRGTVNSAKCRRRVVPRETCRRNPRFLPTSVEVPRGTSGGRCEESRVACSTWNTRLPGRSHRLMLSAMFEDLRERRLRRLEAAPGRRKNLASCSTWNTNVARRQVSRVDWLLSEIFEGSEGPVTRSLGGPTPRSTWNCLSQNLRGASALRDASFA
jgi:hypothetical protein